MEGWITIVHLWAFYLVIKSMFSIDDGKKLWHRWINFSLVIASIVAIYGLFQVFGWADMHFDTVRIDASFGNPTYLAAYLLFHVFFAAYLFVDVWGRKERSAFKVYAYLIAALLFAFDIFKTGTRGTFLGLICGLLVSLLVFSIWGSQTQRKWRLLCGSIIGIIIIFGGVFWLNRDNTLVQSNPTLKRFASISWTASDQSRQYIWPIALQGIEEKPLLGWGQDNFDYLFRKHYNPAMYDVEQWVDRAHNIFLDQLATSGLIGLIAYLAIYVFFLIAVWKSSLKLSGKCIIVGLTFGYIVHNIFVFDTLASYVLFFAMLAFVDSLHQNKVGTRLEKFSVPVDVTKFIIAPIIFILSVTVIYYFNVRPLLANEYLSMGSNSCSNYNVSLGLFQKATSSSNAMSSQYVLSQVISCTENVLSDPLASGSLKQSFINLSTEQIKAQVARTPKDAYIYYVSGPFMKQIGKFSEAESLLNKAHSLAPNEQVISFELASVYLFEGKDDQAVAVLKQAYDLAPGYSKAASAYAVALMIASHGKDTTSVPGADTSLIDEAKAYMISGQLSQATGVYQSIIAQSQGIEALVQQARIQYAAGNTAQAIAILRAIESSHPEDKDQIEAAIKAVQP
jgi:O-antigen ligase/Flp pilus assembly protein TadD